MADSSIAPRSLNPVVWVIVIACVAVKLIVLPIIDSDLRWNGIGSSTVNQAGAVAAYIGTVASALTIVVMAYLFGRPGTRPISSTMRTWIDGVVAVWVAAVIVSAVSLWFDFSAPTRIWVSFFVPGLITALASARVLWLTPPERRQAGRSITVFDRGLAVAVVAAGVIEVLGFLDQEAAGRDILFLWGVLLPIIQVGAILWLLASPHPRPMRARDVALMVATVPVLATVGFYLYAHFFGGGLRISIALVTILIPLVAVYLAYWAWEHVENEPVDFGDDHIDWTTTPNTVPT